MADLRTTFAGIKSPNPFWLASGPPTDKEYNVARAFKAGWGGVVWKTLGEDPPIVNTCVALRRAQTTTASPHGAGFNNIELITDRPLDVNLREIKQVKRDWPDRAMVVSLMVPCDRRADWKARSSSRGRGYRRRRGRAQFRLPPRHVRARHGRGRRPGAGIYRDGHPLVPRSTRAMPVFVKLTPNVSNILGPARAAQEGRRRCGLADQHRGNSIIGPSTSMSWRPPPSGRRQGKPMAAIAVRRCKPHRAATWSPRSPATPICAGLPDLRHRRHRELA